MGPSAFPNRPPRTGLVFIGRGVWLSAQYQLNVVGDHPLVVTTPALVPIVVSAHLLSTRILPQAPSSPPDDQRGLHA